jgi:hypothetical protein
MDVPWTYKGIDVYPHDHNTMGLRWDARSPWGRLRADSKQGMKSLINQALRVHGLIRADLPQRAI